MPFEEKKHMHMYYGDFLLKPLLNGTEVELIEKAGGGGREWIVKLQTWVRPKFHDHGQMT